MGAEQILGAPDFPEQGQAAYFNVLFYRQLGYPAPAYASLAEQEMSGDAHAAVREKIVTIVKDFIKRGRYQALSREEPVHTASAQQQQPAPAGKQGGRR